MAVGRGWSAPAQIIHQRGPDFVGQRQQQGLPSFRLGNPHAPSAPVKVVQRQRRQFRLPQPIRGRQQQNRKVARTQSGRTIHPAQQLLQLCPGQRVRQALLLIDPNRVNPRMQRLAQRSFQELKTEKTTDKIHHTFHRQPRTATRHLSHKTMDMDQFQFAHGHPAPVKAQRVEKITQVTAMPADRALRQTAIFAQMPDKLMHHLVGRGGTVTNASF